MRQELELQLWRRGREGGGGGEGGSRVQQASQQAAFRALSSMKIMLSKVDIEENPTFYKLKVTVYTCLWS